MRNILRKFIKFVVILGVLYGVLMLAAVLFTPTEKIRVTVASKVAEATGAEVTLGDASLSFFPALGISLSEGHISGTGLALARATGSENSLQDYSVDLEKIDVRLSILPLLKKTIVIDAIRAAGPSLRIKQVEGETLVENYSLIISHLSLPVDEVQQAKQDPEAPAGKNHVPPGERIPQGLVFDVEFLAQGVTHQRSLYTDVIASGRMDDKVFTTNSLSATLGGGELTGDIILDWAQEPWGKLAFNVAIAGVSSGALLGPWLAGAQQRLDCSLDGGVAGGCLLKDAETRFNTLDIAGNLHSGEGVLYAQDLLYDVGQYLGKRQDLKDIPFHALSHNFSVENGRYLVKDLVIDGRETDWTCDGWIDPKGSMELGVRVKLPPGFTPELGKWSFLAESLRDSEGRVPLAFKIRGEASRPKVVMDFSGFGKMAQTGEVQAKQAVESATKKGLREILDKWKIR